MNAHLSIVTVTFEAVETLERTLASFVAQTWRDFEVVLVDGASKDGTVDLARRMLEGSGLDFRIVSEPDDGIYDAMNKGLTLARGRYLLFINSGDELHDPGTLEGLFSLPDADVYYGRTRHMRGTVPEHVTRIPDRLDWRTMRRGMVVSHQSIVVRRELAVPYDSAFRIVADYDWIIGCLRRAQTVVRADLILSRYLLDGFSERSFHQAWKERLRILKRHYGWFGVLSGRCQWAYAILRWRLLRKAVAAVREALRGIPTMPGERQDR